MVYECLLTYGCIKLLLFADILLSFLSEISSILDFLFSNLNAPSMIAAAAICASFQGLRLQIGSLCPSKFELVQMISEITGVDEVSDV